MTDTEVVESKRFRWGRPALIASACLIAVGGVGASVAVAAHDAAVDAAVRASLRHRISVAESLAETAAGAAGVAADKRSAFATCVATDAAFLADVSAGSTRFDAPVVTTSAGVVTQSSSLPGLSIPTWKIDSAVATGTATAEELQAVYAERLAVDDEILAALRQDVSAADQVAVDCNEAARAVAAVGDEATQRTGEVVGANPKASAASISELQAARAAVVAVERGAVARWIAAAAAVEASQQAAVKAEQEAEAAAERRRESSGGGGVIYPIPMPTPIWPTYTFAPIPTTPPGY